MTRREDDAPAFRHIVLPLEFDPDNADPIDWRKERGELLSPERFSKEYWEKRFENALAEVRSAQYNQKTLSSGLGLFKKEDFRYWDTWADLPDDGVWSASLDAALKGRARGRVEKEEAKRSYWVCQAWLSSGRQRAMLGQVRFRDDFAVAMSTVTEFLGALNDEIIQQRRLGNIKWSSGRFLIEDQANGPAAISTWNASGIPAGLALEPVNPGTKSKLARAEACLATVRSGNVWLPSPKSKAHYEGMLERVTTFPRSKTDDEVDAMTQYLLFNLEEDFNVSRMMSNLKGLAEGLKLANSRTSW